MFFVIDWIDDFLHREKQCSCAELKELIAHCWVHSGYHNCGYKQMTTRQKDLYDKTIRDIEI